MKKTSLKRGSLFALRLGEGRYELFGRGYGEGEICVGMNVCVPFISLRVGYETTDE